MLPKRKSRRGLRPRQPATIRSDWCSRAAESWRILLGLPISGHELTEDHNPLEAGLRDAVCFDKGCYVGQEVVARLNTYDKVSRTLVGLTLPDGSTPPATDVSIYFRQDEVGRVTSSTVPPGWSHPVALAYLKRRIAEAGIELFSLENPPLDVLQLDVEITSTEEGFRLKNNVLNGRVRPDLVLRGTGRVPFLLGTVYVDPTRVRPNAMST